MEYKLSKNDKIKYFQEEIKWEQEPCEKVTQKYFVNLDIRYDIDISNRTAHLYCSNPDFDTKIDFNGTIEQLLKKICKKR